MNVIRQFIYIWTDASKKKKIQEIFKLLVFFYHKIFSTTKYLSAIFLMK